MYDICPKCGDHLPLCSCLIVPAAPRRKIRMVYIEHTVQRYDSMWGIAQRYGVSTDMLCEANPGWKPLVVGDVVKVPAVEEVIE